ncbi:MAG: general secretion pathway protein GspD [Bacteroidia bacterium]|nr:general secretion pathway protein GspD [Bacteroidia bacterium]
MTLKFKKNLLCIILFFAVQLVNAQERFEIIENKLKEIAKSSPGLNEKVELSVNGASIQDFIRGIATTNNLNVSVDASLNTKIVNNFSNVTVSDVLLFLCKKYDLDIVFIGNIMSISQYAAPAIVNKYTPKQLKISYEKTGNILNLELSNDSLALVAKEITKQSQKNVLFAPDLSGKLVSGYIQNTPFTSALEKLAFANDLKVTPTNDNFYLIEKAEVSTSKSNNKSPFGSSSSNNAFSVKSDGNKLISVDAANAPIAEILEKTSNELKINYFLSSEPKGSTSLTIKNSTYDDFLNYLFNGTEYTYKKEGEIYLIGDRGIEGLRSTKVITLKYRTVEKLIDHIPSDLKKGIEIKTFAELNSLIVCGSSPRIEELNAFIREIDRVVPVISIEVIIVDIRNSHTVSTGIKAGLGSKPTTTGGEVFPSLDLNLGAGAINSVIDGINGLGIVNLGKVTPNFYVSLQLLEQNGDLKINSTPLLSTLNGHEAKMSIGETRFYVENNSNIITTQSTTTVNTQVFKPLNADFSMTVNPIVSGDEQITLDISVKKQSFTEQTAGKNGPYGTTSRDFQSLIRIKNQEMIMLGGLDEEVKDESSSGVPILSRIPVIKWFFSSRTKKKSKSKLTIFIKPTVIY